MIVVQAARLHIRGVQASRLHYGGPTMFRDATKSMFVSCLVLSAALAAPPQIARVTTPSLQTGATTTLIIEGTDLTPNPRLILPVPIAAQIVKDGATDKRVQIDVKLADSVTPGVYQMRLGCDRGISNPVSVEI